MWSTLDWFVRKDTHNIDIIDPKYSDDMAFIRSTNSKINRIKSVMPGMLAESDLIGNSGKREELEISRN